MFKPMEHVYLSRRRQRNIGARDSLKTRVLGCNPAIYFNGCPCHILHKTAQKAGESFTECCGFDVEEFAIDLYYWFDKSTKRKNGLQSYCIFCNQEYRTIVKHVSTRWLSLEIAVQRSLKQLPSLTSYFKSECESQARFKRLQRVLADPMTEVYLLFSICSPKLHMLQPVFAKRRTSNTCITTTISILLFKGFCTGIHTGHTSVGIHVHVLLQAFTHTVGHSLSIRHLYVIQLVE